MNVTYTTISKTIARAKSDQTISKDIKRIKNRLIKNSKTLSEIG